MKRQDKELKNVKKKREKIRHIWLYQVLAMLKLVVVQYDSRWSTEQQFDLWSDLYFLGVHEMVMLSQASHHQPNIRIYKCYQKYNAKLVQILVGLVESTC